MTEKRYYAHKHLLHENEVHDKRCHRFMSLDETVEHLNNEYWKYKQLKNENEQLKQENEWLKSEIQKLYNFVKIDVDHNIEVYPKSLMEHILEILKIIGDVE